MTQITVRGLPDEVKTRLRVQAAQAGRSLEAEVRIILAKAVDRGGGRHALAGLQEWFQQNYKAKRHGSLTDDLIAERRREAKREAARGW